MGAKNFDLLQNFREFSTRGPKSFMALGWSTKSSRTFNPDPTLSHNAHMGMNEAESEDEDAICISHTNIFITP